MLVTARKLDQLDESKVIPARERGIEDRPKPLGAVEFELDVLDELEGVGARRARPQR